MKFARTMSLRSPAHGSLGRDGCFLKSRRGPSGVRIGVLRTLAAIAVLMMGRVVWSGQAPAADSQAAAGAVPAEEAPLTAKSPARVRLIDVNHATLEELESLPGIAEAYAANIIKNRPDANKTQLSSKGVLSAATYARIKSLIVAKH